MEKTTVYLPTDLKRRLERTARAQGRSEADLIREGVAIVTRQAWSPAPTLPPLFSSDQPDLAERVDEALEGFGQGTAR
jgi:hypothetical protein